MAVKTFTTNEVLTSTDTNTYLANAGLVYVTTAVIPASPASTSVAVTNCFSSTYDSYRIVVSGVVCSAGGVSAKLTFGSTATGYYGNQPYWTTAGSNGFNSQSNAAFLYCGSQDTTNFSLTCDIIGPYTATWTQISGFSYGANASTIHMGALQNTTSYTGFTLTPSGGGTPTFANGAITVYGYRKA